MALTLDGTAGITASGNITAAYFLGNASQLTGISSSKIYNGTSEANIGTSGGNANISIGGVSNVAIFTSTGANITGTFNASGNITGGNLTVSTGTITGGNIVNANANGVGNIGSSTTYFNTVFAKATSAQYADLAEMYVADRLYTPGTVVVFGGENEITMSTESNSTNVAGVISTNPSYLMNSTQEGQYVLPVALVGRVPCQVKGPVAKGDVLVSSSTPGVAEKINESWQPGATIGKALQSSSSTEVSVIEIVVGRF